MIQGMKTETFLTAQHEEAFPISQLPKETFFTAQTHTGVPHSKFPEYLETFAPPASDHQHWDGLYAKIGWIPWHST